MSELKTGIEAPPFTAPADGGRTISLADFKGKKIVLYFYPKDDTPGCTTESCAFRDNIKDFEKQNVQVIGVSRDTPESHDKFKKKYGLTFPLVSDTDGKICEAYGVWVEKNMYGKKSMGIERSTFLIDEHGKIAKTWRKVKVETHLNEVKEALQIKSAA